MSEEGLAECCLEIVVVIGLSFFLQWCGENPPCGVVVIVAVLGGLMVGVPLYWFVKECTHKTKGSLVVGYFLGFFGWIIAITLSLVCCLIAVYGVLAFVAVGVIGLLYLFAKGRLRKRDARRRQAKAWEVTDQLRALGEKRSAGHITLAEYDRQRKQLQEELKQLRAKRPRSEIRVPDPDVELAAVTSEVTETLAALKTQRDAGALTQKEYEQKRGRLLRGLRELKHQLGRGAIHLAEYNQKKRELIQDLIK